MWLPLLSMRFRCSDISCWAYFLSRHSFSKNFQNNFMFGKKTSRLKTLFFISRYSSFSAKSKNFETLERSLWMISSEWEIAASYYKFTPLDMAIFNEIFIHGDLNFPLCGEGGFESHINKFCFINLGEKLQIHLCVSCPNVTKVLCQTNFLKAAREITCSLNKLLSV